MAGEPNQGLAQRLGRPGPPEAPPTPGRPWRRRVAARLGFPWTPRTWAAAAVAALVAVSFLGAATYYYQQQESIEHDYVELYVTDLPANFTRLEIHLRSVTVGDRGYPLVLDSPAFDLLSLRGPTQALRVASGYVPTAEHAEIRIEFASARAELNGHWLPLDLPDNILVVGHAFGMGHNPASAFLFDLDVEKSVRVSADGLVFRPHVDAVYVHHYGADAGQPGGPVTSAGPAGFSKTDPKPFDNESRAPPQKQSLTQPPARPGPGESSPGPSSKPRFQWNAPSESSPSTSPGPGTSESGPPPSTSDDPLSSALPSPGDPNSVPRDPDDVGGWFGHFKVNPPPVIIETIEAYGGVVFLLLASEPIVYFFATPGQAENISRDPNVLLVEADSWVDSHLQSSRNAIRLPQVSDPVLGLRDGAGNPIDGRGVGVAVIDLGIDGTHPDLPYKGLHPDPLILANYKVESLFTVDVPSTDQSSGHGTHVAGILAGRGVADPLQQGVAPGVKVYGFGIGEGGTTLWPVTALDWVVQNHDKVNPPIRVVQNSWGTTDPSTTIERLVARLAAEGVVVVFSADNKGGDGSSVRTSHQCRIPTEGVICVASFDDFDLGVRDGRLSSFSSRGDVTNPASWPDLAAPGATIRSARPVFGFSTGPALLDRYTVLSGTSMAAPHVSAVAAMMLQAKPSLTPAQVEALLESSAYEFPDGGSYFASSDARYNGAHFAKGHGLLDAFAAVQAAQAS